jgi:pyruvate formate lyase activating enzyme
MKCLGCTAAATALTQTDLLPPALGGIQNAMAFDYTTELSSVEARYYEKRPEGGVICKLCPRQCLVTDLERGYCGVRENRGDTYYTLVYGRPCSMNIDPIEKKPLFHFYPGTQAFSLATAGCNANCKFCQNWEISQVRPEQTQNFNLPPKDVIEICRQRQIPNIAYTYSEPIIFYEYMYDIAELGHKNNIKSVMITGGYIETKPLADLLPKLDAVKVDLKAIRQDYYKKIVNVDLQPILDTLVQIKKAGIWLEIVYLVVPTLNDSEQEFKELATWVKNYLGPDIPVHFSRFYPQYLLKDLPPTPAKTLEAAWQICKAEGLHYVYIGNIPGHEAESTFCPGCGQIVIGRRGYRITQYNLDGNLCRKCQREIPGLF